MPLLKKILNSSPREVVIKWTGSGTDTVTLASLVSANQTLTGVLAPDVVIFAVYASLDNAGTCIISRNNEETLHVSDNFIFQMDGNLKFIINENGGADINVSLATLGTLILRLSKVTGYTGI